MKQDNNRRSYITVLYLLKKEKGFLFLTSVTGIFYNVGLAAGPWLEGLMVQSAVHQFQGSEEARDLIQIALIFIAVMALVQGCRALKRLFVRKFANEISYYLKETIYENLLGMSHASMEKEKTGSIMTKVISDADACAEGIRKVTTEIFDTGVVMIAYIVMLFYYDPRLTILVLLFPPVAYFISNHLKVKVEESTRRSRESSEALAESTLDRLSNNLTYRMYGTEEAQEPYYENFLSDYASKNTTAAFWETAVEPIYRAIVMAGAIFIIWLGGRNVLGLGWTQWDIAAFSTYILCFLNMAVKASHAAHLINAWQNARVSWERVHPYLILPDEGAGEAPSQKGPVDLIVKNVSFTYPGDKLPVYTHLSFEAHTGQIIGLSGKVACGKSTVGRTFLCENPYKGEITVNGKILGKEISPVGLLGYMGHDPELFSGSVEDNITLGKEGDCWPALEAAALDQDVKALPDGLQTTVGEAGLRLSGGQQARLALARTIYHKKPILILDDPCASVDSGTEAKIMKSLRQLAGDALIILISHRLSYFPDLDGVIWMNDDGTFHIGDHASLYQTVPAYKEAYDDQALQKEQGGRS